MNKTAVQTGIACFLFGLGCGFWSAPKIQHIGFSKPVLTGLTSEGRAEVRRMIDEINFILDEDAGNIIVDKTKALQSVTSKTPDRTAADFYLSGAVEKMKETQFKIDSIVLDAVERMPWMDRRTYMKAYLKNRFPLRAYNIALPFGMERTVETAGRPE